MLSLFKSSSQEVSSKSYGFMLDKLLAHSVHEISVSSVCSKGVIFLDARKKTEFDISRIDSAVWVGYEDFELERINTIDKDSKLIVYCSVGYRSEKIAQKLLGAGYSDVSNLYGGIFEWVNQGNEIVDDKGVKTDKIHGFSRVWGVWLNKGQKVYDSE